MGQSNALSAVVGRATLPRLDSAASDLRLTLRPRGREGGENLVGYHASKRKLKFPGLVSFEPDSGGPTSLFLLPLSPTFGFAHANHALDFRFARAVISC